MLKTVFFKTLYEKRWMTLMWCVGVAAMAFLMVLFYPSFKEGGFDEALKSLPKSFQGLVGSLASLKTVPGYISQQVFALRIPLLALIMSIMLFSGLLAGDEGSGTLQTLLVQPVSRLRVYAEKFLAGAVISLAVCSGAIFGILGGLAIIHESMGFGRLLESVVGVWLLTLLFGALAFALGAITGKRGLAGGAAGLFAFSAYLITSFVPNVSGLTTIEKLSPFHYYNSPAIAVNGLNGRNVFIMLAATFVLVVVAGVIFKRRDIYQQ